MKEVASLEKRLPDFFLPSILFRLLCLYGGFFLFTKMTLRTPNKGGVKRLQGSRSR